MRSRFWQLQSEYPVINGVKLVPPVRWFFFCIWFSPDLLSVEGTDGTGAVLCCDEIR